MATQPRIPVRSVRTLSGLSIPREEFPEASGQTYNQGALVFLNGGFLQECGANPPLIMGVATRPGQNGGSNGAKRAVVDLAHPDTLFLASIDTSASEGTGVTANTDIGAMYGVTKAGVGNNAWYPDKNKTSAATRRVIIWNVWLNAQDAVTQAIGDTLGWVVFSFDPQFFQGQHTS